MSVREWGHQLYWCNFDSRYNNGSDLTARYGGSRTGDSSTVRVIPTGSEYTVCTGTRRSNLGVRYYENVCSSEEISTKHKFVPEWTYESVYSMDFEDQVLVVGTSTKNLVVINTEHMTVSASKKCDQPVGYWNKHALSVVDKKIFTIGHSKVFMWDLELLQEISSAPSEVGENSYLYRSLHTDNSSLVCFATESGTSVFDFRQNGISCQLDKQAGNVSAINMSTSKNNVWISERDTLLCYDLRAPTSHLYDLSSKILKLHGYPSLYGLYRDDAGRGLVGNVYGDLFVFDANAGELLGKVDAGCVGPIDIHWSDGGDVVGVAIQNPESAWSSLDTLVIVKQQQQNQEQPSTRRRRRCIIS